MSYHGSTDHRHTSPKMPLSWWLERYNITAREGNVCRMAANALANGDAVKHGNTKTEGPASIIDRELPDTGLRRRVRLYEVALEMEREAS